MVIGLWREAGKAKVKREMYFFINSEEKRMIWSLPGWCQSGKNRNSITTVIILFIGQFR
jgi:hypothetical protein